ncbi:MAG: hypothetical protein J5I47_04220 [Vicingus serpentipes]|nr:hypothetical protein [Vicingus serpentipes]
MRTSLSIILITAFLINVAYSGRVLANNRCGQIEFSYNHQNNSTKEAINNLKKELNLNLLLEETFEEETDEDNLHLLFFLIPYLNLEIETFSSNSIHYSDFIRFVETAPLFLKFCCIKIPS